jgi:DNA processing protein
MDDERPYWLAFNHVQGIGAARVQKLLAAFGTLHEAWEASLQDLASCGLDVRSANQIVTERANIHPLELVDRCSKLEIEVLTLLDPTYPRRLKEIPLPPPVLYLRGTYVALDELAIGLVGTRRATNYGRTVARSFAEEFAANHVTVVSGMARGVDAEAHAACLDAGGRTLAVLGCGVDVLYPPEHRLLADRIVSSGALLSDYPPGTPPDAVNFPPRNRLIAGLSLATIVVEAGMQSGALLTAKYAADYGRDVFAVPGNIFSPSQQGCHQLLADGVAPALSVAHVLATLDFERTTQLSQARMLLPEGPIETKVLQVLEAEPQHIDLVRVRANLPIEEVSAALTMMELKGMVRQIGGMQYALCR